MIKTVPKKKTQAIATLELSKIAAEIIADSATPLGKKMIDRILITESGSYKRPLCRTGWLLLRGHARRPISELGERWLRRWTVPGLDATTCRCPQCGGVRYSDEQMVARLRNKW